MTKDIECLFGELVSLYKEWFKPAYADLVAYIAKKPENILTEIENTFSHLMIALDNSEDENLRKENIRKAYNHLARATLDCYKILWIEIEKDINNIYHSDVKRLALTISEIEFLKLKKQFKEAILKARKIEHQYIGKDPLKAVPYYIEAIEIGKQIVDSLDENKENLAKKYTLKNFLKREVIMSFLLGIITGIIANWLYSKIFP